MNSQKVEFEDKVFQVGDMVAWGNDTKTTVCTGIVVEDAGAGEDDRYSVVWLHKSDRVVESDLIDCSLVARLQRVKK